MNTVRADDTEVMTNQLAGASVWEEALYQHLISHEENERELLRVYQDAAVEAKSPAFSYLVSMIVEDEVRHHRQFTELAQTIRADAEFHQDGPVVPRLGGWGRNPTAISDITERLIEHERQDLRSLQDLVHDLDEVKDTTLWQLLVRLMETDTRKHIEILEFVRRHAKKVR